MNKEIKTLLKLAEDQGCTVVHRRNGHYGIKCLTGVTIWTSSTPSDKRAMLNIRSHLKQQGVKL